MSAFTAFYTMSLVDYFIMYFPTFIILAFTSISLNKFDTFANAADLLGNKVGCIKNKNNTRLFFIIPIYLLLICYTVFAIYIFNKLKIINFLILISSIVLALIFEHKIYKYNEMKGIYEKGILYKKGAFLYDEIPEIMLIKDGIEILNHDGMKEDIKLDSKSIEYLSNTFFKESKKMINENWQDNITNARKPHRNCAGRLYWQKHQFSTEHSSVFGRWYSIIIYLKKDVSKFDIHIDSTTKEEFLINNY